MLRRFLQFKLIFILVFFSYNSFAINTGDLPFIYADRDTLSERSDYDAENNIAIFSSNSDMPAYIAYYPKNDIQKNETPLFKVAYNSYDGSGRISLPHNVAESFKLEGQDADLFKIEHGENSSTIEGYRDRYILIKLKKMELGFLSEHMI